MIKIFAPVFVALIVVLDQLSKWWMLEGVFRPALGLGDPMRLMDWLLNAPARLTYVSLPVLPVLNFTMVWNEGISFGLLSSGGWGLLTIISLVIAVLFFIWMIMSGNLYEKLALAMIVGGALGNVFDRVRFGAVADFIDFYYKNVHFPAFNVADASISLGVVVLLIQGLFFAKNSA
jgi:signal peptidase II